MFLPAFTIEDPYFEPKDPYLAGFVIKKLNIFVV